MMTVFDPPPQTVVWDLLGPFNLPTHPSKPSWDELKQAYDGRIGVIRSADDWAQMPRQATRGRSGWVRIDAEGNVSIAA